MMQDLLKRSLSYTLEKYEITPEEYYELSRIYTNIVSRVFNIKLLPNDREEVK